MPSKLSLRFLLLALSMGLILMAGTIVYAQSGSATPTADEQADDQVEEKAKTKDTKKAEVARPAAWSEETHSNDADPNYNVVFPQDQVNQITITLSAENWEAMQANMTELFGEPGSRRQGPGGGVFGMPRAGANAADLAQPTSPLLTPGSSALPGNGEPPVGFERPAGGGPGFGGGDFTPENPMWVTATIEFEGDTWTNVGVRYKGNSSLRSGWDSKSLKLPFKLDFDEFEDDYPEIDNQRFYGFKQLSLANGFGDASYMRDAITYNLLEEAGLVAAETAFYEVIVDYGEGPVSLGVYTMIEVIDDTVIDRTFDGDSGNIYEADGRAASLAAGTFDQIEESFQKENNEDEADWSDIEALYTVLHADERTTDPAAWRAALESIFDVDTFLEWLAISAAIQHWDTYGGMTHNYYLYHNPETDRLTWISWDHNLVLGGGGGMRRPGDNGQNAAGAGRGPGGMGGPGGRSTSLDKADVNANWPLIRYLLDDPIYYASYRAYLAQTGSELLDPDKLAEQYQAWAEILAPYAAEENSATAFESAVQQLIDRTYERAAAVEVFLQGQK